jgi:hypothetical protein
VVLGGRNFNVTSFFQFHKFIYLCNPFSENVHGHPCFFIGLPKYREIVNVYVFKISLLYMLHL